MNYIQFTANGSVDIDASCEAYREALETWVLTHEENERKLREHVVNVLRVAGKNIPFPTLVGMVCVRLQPTAEQYEVVSTSVEEFLKGSIGEKGGSSLLYAKKGKGGGVGLNSTETEETEAA